MTRVENILNELRRGLPRTRRKLFIDSKKPVGVSFPKSGRTWLRKMLFDLQLSIHFSHAGSNLYETGALPNFDEIERYVDRSVIFIVRDPRDVLVSYHEDLVHRHKVFDGSLLDMAKAPSIGIEGICAFNTLWLKRAKQLRGFRLVRYEALRSQPEETLAELCKFLGAFWITRGGIRTVVANSSFDRMQRGEQSGEYLANYPKYWFEGAEGQDRPRKVRRGQAGGFVDEMPEDVRIYCNERIRRCGYPEHLLAVPLT